MIQTIFWDRVSTAWQPTSLVSLRHVHAVWPSPVDADACFRNAGFTEFADTDDEWDSDWRTVVEAVITYLARFGHPAIREPIVPVTESRLWDRLLGRASRHKEISLPLVDQVVLATMDDQFPHAVVDFGEGHDVTLVAGDGHPVLWIFSNPESDLSISGLGSQLGQNRSYDQRTLDWPCLGPPEVAV